MVAQHGTATDFGSCVCGLESGRQTLCWDIKPYAYDIVWKARCAHLSTSHHIKPVPLWEGFMWWRVLRWAHLAVPNDAVCIFSYEYPSETATINWEVKRFGETARWADLTIRLVVSTGESHRLVCENMGDTVARCCFCFGVGVCDTFYMNISMKYFINTALYLFVLCIVINKKMYDPNLRKLCYCNCALW